jgi:hypothetical protein
LAVHRFKAAHQIGTRIFQWLFGEKTVTVGRVHRLIIGWNRYLSFFINGYFYAAALLCATPNLPFWTRPPAHWMKTIKNTYINCSKNPASALSALAIAVP